jgi:UDP-N-acetylmuramoylalanine--D-glutamate ligase
MLGEENLKGKKVGVVGLGLRTGVSSVRYLCSQGADVVAYDRKPESGLTESLAAMKGLPFHLEAGTEHPRSLSSVSLLIVSPGVPLTQPFLLEARKAGVPVWSEIEFASRRISAPILAVTGSNGKSTTTALLGHILSGWRKKVFTGGNLGTPLVTALDEEFDFVVAEVSSFQLEAVETFRPRVGILLNVVPNHLDRHGTFANYLAAKERLFSRMIQEDRAVLNIEDRSCREAAQRIRASTWFFSGKANAKADLHADRKKIVLRDGRSISLAGFRLFGDHNVENALAASAAALAVGCPIDRIEKGLQTFSALPHRLERLATVDGVDFVNDSKSTTPDATIKALHSFESPILLLAGGRSKGAPYEALAKLARGKVKKAFFYGEAAGEMSRSFASVPQDVVSDLDAAFGAALEAAKTGDVVLLSPANTSFDQFRDFEERGRRFASLVSEHRKHGKGKRR